MEVLPDLFLGNEADSRGHLGMDPEAVVVNCTADLPFHGCPTTQTQIRIPAKDNGDPRQQEVFFDAAAAAVPRVLELIMGGKRTLVHCRAGQQRSAAFVVVLLLASNTCATVPQAVEFVRSKKPDAFLGGAVNFREAIVRLHGTIENVR
jgi:protein-tyrosine phosphatase